MHDRVLRRKQLVCSLHDASGCKFSGSSGFQIMPNQVGRRNMLSEPESELFLRDSEQKVPLPHS